MTVDDWLAAAIGDVERRGLPQVTPVLRSLASALTMLRTADWNADASRRPEPPAAPRDAAGTPSS